MQPLVRDISVSQNFKGLIRNYEFARNRLAQSVLFKRVESIRKHCRRNQSYRKVSVNKRSYRILH